jgi:FKBP-type peptidyl-prolyl cis-trans isomerase FkpA
MRAPMVSRVTRLPRLHEILVLAALFAPLAQACSKGAAEPAESHYKPAAAAPADPGPATLQILDDLTGKGKTAKPGDKVRVHYTGTLMSGKEFDSSRERGPFDFTLGKGEVIKGWDEGVVGMKVGGKRRLVIPEALGYGEAGNPPTIPPKAGLKFEVELLEINPATPAPGASPSPDLGGADPELDPSMMGDPDDQPMEEPPQ